MVETTNSTRQTIDESIAPKLREWFASGRGVRVWTNQELGVDRPQQFTPADNVTPPHWAYTLGTSIVLEPGNIDVETFVECTRFRGRLKRYYWGIGLTSASENKAMRMLAAGEKFFWEYDQDSQGCAQVLIGTITLRPFSV